MRVLHLIKTPVGAGWALRQIRELVQLGVTVHVALPGEGPMRGRYNEVGAIEHTLQTDFPVRAPRQFPKLAPKFLRLSKVYSGKSSTVILSGLPLSCT